MAYMKSTGESLERTQFTVDMNPQLYDSLRDKCRAEGISLNIILECFLRQYTNEGLRTLPIDNYLGPTVKLSTTVNKGIADAFKKKCKIEGNTIKLVVGSFVAGYNKGKYELALRRKLS